MITTAHTVNQETEAVVNNRFETELLNRVRLVNGTFCELSEFFTGVKFTLVRHWQANLKTDSSATGR